jgi:hypothetical protein
MSKLKGQIIYLTEDEKEIIKEKAEKEKCSMSRYFVISALIREIGENENNSKKQYKEV